MIRAAPVPFGMVTIAIVGIVWIALNWSYSSVLASKSSQIELLDRQIADYKDAKARIDALEARVMRVEERQLQTQNATEMKALLLGLNTAKSGTGDAHANARALGAFGGSAVPPMIELLNEGTVGQMEAVQQGLFVAGLTDLNGTCTILIRVLNNRTRRFNWITHKAVAGLLADLNCPEAPSALLSYQNLLNLGLEHYAKVVDPPESPDKFDTLKKAIREDRSRLNEGD